MDNRGHFSSNGNFPPQGYHRREQSQEGMRIGNHHGPFSSGNMRSIGGAVHNQQQLYWTDMYNGSNNLENFWLCFSGNTSLADDPNVLSNFSALAQQRVNHFDTIVQERDNRNASFLNGSAVGNNLNTSFSVFGNLRGGDQDHRVLSDHTGIYTGLGSTGQNAVGTGIRLAADVANGNFLEQRAPTAMGHNQSYSALNQSLAPTLLDQYNQALLDQYNQSSQMAQGRGYPAPNIAYGLQNAGFPAPQIAHRPNTQNADPQAMNMNNRLRDHTFQMPHTNAQVPMSSLPGLFNLSMNHGSGNQQFQMNQSSSGPAPQLPNLSESFQMAQGSSQVTMSSRPAHSNTSMNHSSRNQYNHVDQRPSRPAPHLPTLTKEEEAFLETPDFEQFGRQLYNYLLPGILPNGAADTFSDAPKHQLLKLAKTLKPMLYDYWRKTMQMQNRGANINIIQWIIDFNAKFAALNSSVAKASNSSDVLNQTLPTAAEVSDVAREDASTSQPSKSRSMYIRPAASLDNTLETLDENLDSSQSHAGPVPAASTKPKTPSFEKMIRYSGIKKRSTMDMDNFVRMLDEKINFSPEPSTSSDIASSVKGYMSQSFLHQQDDEAPDCTKNVHSESDLKQAEPQESDKQSDKELPSNE